MCCTCDANRLIDAYRNGEGATFTWRDASEVALDAEVVGERAECSPAQVRVRKKGGDWSAWFDTDDLAATMMRLGTDVPWSMVSDDVRAWLTGSGYFPYSAVRGVLGGEGEDAP